MPIVAVTAYTTEHDRDECLMVGMNDYLPKPIMLESLRRVKDDAKEVLTGYECGIGVENFNDIKVGDQLEAFVMDEVAATL